MTNFIASRRFFYIIVSLFALQAIWIAVTGRYPLAFDENFHFGLIQLYAKHWLPFLDAQPPDASVYGAVARDPSYLYHYLMSFPYRLVAQFVHGQTAQIIILRLINVGLAVTSLFVYAKVLRLTPLSAAWRNAILFFFIAIPVFPFLSGQISYDNLAILLVGLVMLWSGRFVVQLKKGVFDGRLLVGLLLLSMLASLAKYAVLPIVAAVGLYLVVDIILFVRRTPGFSRRLLGQIRGVKMLVLVLYIIVFAVVGLLFVQRYGINLVRYHTPIPDCAQVISVDECKEYAPWGRDYGFAKDYAQLPRDNIARYANTWIRQMMREFFFTVYSAFRGNTTVVDYWGSEPVPVLLVTGWTILIVGTSLTFMYARKLWLQYDVLRLFAVATLVYVAVLFVQNYQAYLATAVPVAIHGRYILMLIPLIFVWFCLAAREALDAVARRFALTGRTLPAIKLGVFVILVMLCTQGGGIITHIIHSGDDNFWQQSAPARSVNKAAQKTLKKVVL